MIKIAFDKANLTSPRSVIDKFRNVIYRLDGGDVKIRKVRHCCLQFEVSASQLPFSNGSYKNKIEAQKELIVLNYEFVG